MKIYIPYEFDNWNQYILKERSNWQWASSLKKKENQVVKQFTQDLKYTGDYPVKVIVTKYFKDKRQDLDNVRIKGVLDGLVKNGVIKNDNLNCIQEIILKAEIDKEKVGLEIEIKEFLENEKR